VRAPGLQVVGRAPDPAVVAIQWLGGSEGRGRFEYRALRNEADFSKAQEDEAEDESLRTATRVFLGFEADIACRPCLLVGIPKPFLKRGVGSVFFGWSDPVHAAGGIVFQVVSTANENEVSLSP